MIANYRCRGLAAVAAPGSLPLLIFAHVAVPGSGVNQSTRHFDGLSAEKRISSPSHGISLPP